MIKLLATTCSRHYNILAKTKKNKIYDTLQTNLWTRWKTSYQWHSPVLFVFEAPPWETRQLRALVTTRATGTRKSKKQWDRAKQQLYMCITLFGFLVNFFAVTRRLPTKWLWDQRRFMEDLKNRPRIFSSFYNFCAVTKNSNPGRLNNRFAILSKLEKSGRTLKTREFSLFVTFSFL